MLKMLLKKIMKAEAMFISSMDPESEPEISGGRLAEPHAFPWYLLVLFIHDICRRRRRHCLWTKQIRIVYMIEQNCNCNCVIVESSGSLKAIDKRVFINFCNKNAVSTNKNGDRQPVQSIANLFY